MTNPVYIGTVVGLTKQKKNHKIKKVTFMPKDKRIYCDNMHDAIIDKEIFDKVQEKLKSSGQIRKRKHDHILKGLIYCQECGAKAMMKVRERPKKSGEISKDTYFLCGRKSNSYYACENGRISEKLITPLVINEIKKECKKIIFTKGELQSLYEQAKLNTNSRKQELLEEIRKEEGNVEKIEKTISEIYTDKLNGIISIEHFTSFYELHQQKKEKMLKNIISLKSELEEIDKQKIVNYSYIKKVAEECLSMEELDKDLLNRLIDRIEYNKDKKITIKYKFTECK